jgi:hypothetical protein
MKLEEFRHALEEEARREPVRVDDLVLRVMRRAHRQRRRQRVVLGATGLVVVALIATAASLVAGDSSEDQFVTTSPASDVVIAVLTTRPENAAAGQYASEVLFVDAATGSSQVQSIPANNYGEYPVQLLQIGSRLLLPGGGVVRSAPADLSRPPEDIAPALVFVPSAARDRVWTVSEWQGGNTAPYTVTEIAADGSPTSEPLSLPAEANWPIAGTDEGLLLRGSGDEVLLWDPDTGEIVRRIAGVQWFQGNGWGLGKLFAWVGPCSNHPRCERLHLVDLSTGHERTVEPPAGTTGFVPDGALSPNGRALALVATTQDGGQQLVLVDTQTGTTQPVPGSMNAGAGVSWTHDGASVFFGDEDSTAISSYHLGDSSSRRIRDHLPPFTAILAVELDDITRGTIEGTLTVVGGRAPGDPRPSAGVVTLQRDGQQVRRVEVSASGAFRIELPPGAYSVSATFGNDLTCGSEPVSVRPGRVSVVAFTCHMR